MPKKNRERARGVISCSWTTAPFGQIGRNSQNNLATTISCSEPIEMTWCAATHIITHRIRQRAQHLLERIKAVVLFNQALVHLQTTIDFNLNTFEEAKLAYRSRRGQKLHDIVLQRVAKPIVFACQESSLDVNGAIIPINHGRSANGLEA